MSEFFKKNILLYSDRPQGIPLSSKWGASFVLNADRDFAQNLMDFAVRFDSLTEKEIFCRRLAVHEAVLNALRYGGKNPILTAWGGERFMQVAIKQKNDIVWPQKTDKYRGTALIQSNVSEIGITDNKKTLLMRFF